MANLATRLAEAIANSRYCFPPVGMVRLKFYETADAPVLNKLDDMEVTTNQCAMGALQKHAYCIETLGVARTLERIQHRCFQMNEVNRLISSYLVQQQGCLCKFLQNIFIGELRMYTRTSISEWAGVVEEAGPTLQVPMLCVAVVVSF